MVHYIRFLKTARLKHRSSKSISVIALITITTDLGDTFLLSDADLISRLVVADDPEIVLCRSKGKWHKGSRELVVDLAADIDQSMALLRLHVYHDKGSCSISSVLDAWSAPFMPVIGSPAEALIERQIYLSGQRSLRIWEETGNSIARHIWDAALGCLLCLEDVVSARSQMPALVRVILGEGWRQIKVLELGTGCGVVGIALAAWFPNCVVHLTDLAEAQDILSKNLKQATPATNSSLQAHTWDWNADPSDACLEQDLALVVVSDCTYNADSCPDLVRTFARICATSMRVKILVAMKRRHDSEDIFFKLMRDARLNVLERTVISLPHEVSAGDITTPEIELYLYGSADGEY